MLAPSSSLPKPAFGAHAAIARFLSDMAMVAKRTFPRWHATLAEGIEACPLDLEDRRAVLDVHPLDDYYFAGVVALEAAKIRQLFAPDDAAELLSQIGEQVDAVAERKDRVVSDLVFFIIGRIDIATGVDKLKMPYDQVVKAILQRIGVDKVEATGHLMTQALYRHTLGEPLALGVPHWWSTFRKKYALAPKSDAVPATIAAVVPADQSVVVPLRRRQPRRAVAF
jgi:hypothetical protein